MDSETQYARDYLNRYWRAYRSHVTFPAELLELIFSYLVKVRNLPHIRQINYDIVAGCCTNHKCIIKVQCRYYLKWNGKWKAHWSLPL
jgi:hypothetical protein